MFHADLLQDAVTLVLLLAVLYHILAMVEVGLFTARPARAPQDSLPPVSVLKPLHRWDTTVGENLATFCRQAYPAYEVVVGYRPEFAPPPGELARFCHPPGGHLKPVLCLPSQATNPKVAQLIQMAPHAAHDVLAIADADIRVSPHYLARAVAPLAAPQVGAVTALYCVREATTLPALIEALIVNTDFTPSVLVARRLFGLHFALGAGVVVRRRVLDAIGGFETLADYLADDYQIGYRVTRAGYRVVLADEIVEHRIGPYTFRDLFRHQLRWARTTRVCRPVGWFFNVITHLTLWTVAWWALSGFSAAGWRVLGTGVVFRVLEGVYFNARLGGLRPAWRGAWLMPVKDLFVSLLWVLSFTGSRVHWAGRVYAVSGDGRMVDITPPQSAPEEGRSDGL